PLELVHGQRARIESTGEEVVVADRASESAYLLDDGRVVEDAELWPLEIADDPLERLATFDTDRPAAFRNRLDGLVLSQVRQAKGLGSFLGGRIKLYPHQLDVAERASASDPVRWILADEVGLGKTIEACLVLSRLVRTERANRVIVVAPSTLTVQWLGELWRKFHQTLVLLDRRRIADVAKELGEGFNPFDAHARVVVALEDFVEDGRLVDQAAGSGPDLLVVDEAHRLDAEDAYRAIAPLARAARHVLLLTATPLEADIRGFFRLLSLVRPDAYTSEPEFLASLAEGRPLPPCTSATRRVDIGGLPPRVPRPVDLAAPFVAPGLTGDERRDAADPRVEWLVGKAADFARGGKDEGKTLVFCHERETLVALKARLESATRRRVGIFHEDLAPERRDLEVAEFRRADGPVFLISTEAGGEGRNFEFCRRLVLFDLPADPAAVEQRIGRLDRINRTRPVEIVYFRPPSGFPAELARLYEEIRIFEEPLGGLERSLSHVEEAIRRAERLGRPLAVAELAGEVRGAAEARQRAVYHHLHTGGYRADRRDEILSRIPGGLDAAMERFVLGACDLYGFETAEKAGKSWYVEFGADALVEHLPGVPGGSRFLGTFDREEAVEREELDFFASGHPLVEGIFQELEDGSRGRTALVRLERAGVEGIGLLLIRKGPDGFVASALDLAGRSHPEWAELLVRSRAQLRGMKREEWGVPGGQWAALCNRVALRARRGRVLAAAGFKISR
ncbi:MAG TPA: SNF2-related protein, partial [Thermoanaerobaculia bacterium]|nr:SNF2-related protein [Thermoanaerobaculia bacterium]